MEKNKLLHLLHNEDNTVGVQSIATYSGGGVKVWTWRTFANTFANAFALKRPLNAKVAKDFAKLRKAEDLVRSLKST